MNDKVKALRRSSRSLMVALVHVLLATCYQVMAVEGQVSLDLRKGLVGPITILDNPDEIRRKLGAANMQSYTGQSEGQEYRGYKLTFPNQQTIDANQSFLTINAIGFRTPEGLGVGSTWREFRTKYVDGELSWLDDAGAIWSEKYKFRLYFKGDKKPALNDQVTTIHLNRAGVEPW